MNKITTNKQINARIPLETHKKLMHMCVDKNKTISEIVAEAIEFYDTIKKIQQPDKNVVGPGVVNEDEYYDVKKPKKIIKT